MLLNRDQWYTNDLRSLKTQKINRYDKAKFLNSESEWNEYKLIRIKWRKNINSTTNSYTKNKIEGSSDQKTMGKNVKKYILRKDNNQITDIRFDNEANK